MDEEEEEDKNEVKVAKKNSRSSGGSRTKTCGESKPCNCRNSRCLKRYCDCFAAGMYCSPDCKCEECHNKPEYEDDR